MKQIHKKDQLLTILNVLGPQKGDKIDFLNSEGKKFMSKINVIADESSIFEKLKNVDKHITKLIERLLKFNPEDRASANDILQDPIFDKIRNRKLEKDPQFTVSVDHLFGCTEVEYMTILKEEIEKIKTGKVHLKLTKASQA